MNQSRHKSIILCLYAGICLLAACGSDRASLLLAVDPVPSGARQVEVELRLGDTLLPVAPFDSGLPVGPLQMGFLLPVGAAGELQITVHVKGSSPCDVARGTTLVQVAAGEQISVTLPLTTLKPAVTTIPQNLFAIWGTAKDNMWTGGAAGGLYKGEGNCWYDYSESATVSISGFSGTSASDIWAVGANNLILHFDGTNWKTNTTMGLPAGDLFAVWAFAKNSAVAAGGANGSTPVYHAWDGVNWVDRKFEIATAATKPLFDIWATSPKDIYVCTAQGTGSIGVLRKQDQTWSLVQTGQVDSVGRSSVFGFSANDVWYGSGSSAMVGKGAVVAHWDGQNYQQFDLPGTAPGDFVNDLWGSSSDDMWFVVYSTTTSPKLYRKIGPGMTFMPVTLPAIAGNPPALTDLWGSGPNDVWIVGSAGLRLHYDGSTFTVFQ